MTEQLVTVSCPLSTLRTIADALDWAEHLAKSRADFIEHVNAMHNSNPASTRPYVTDTIDDVKYYRRDAEQFRQAYALADNLWLHGIATTYAEAPQTQDYAPSELVPF